MTDARHRPGPEPSLHIAVAGGEIILRGEGPVAQARAAFEAEPRFASALCQVFALGAFYGAMGAAEYRPARSDTTAASGKEGRG
jgi:hypothetical protein